MGLQTSAFPEHIKLVDRDDPNGDVSVEEVGTKRILAVGLFDAAGNQITTFGSNPVPNNATTYDYSSSLVIKSSSGILYGINGYNADTAAQFIQLYNATSLPPNGAVPVIVFSVGAQHNFYINFGSALGRYFSLGIVVCNSMTGSSKTLGPESCWFDAQYT